MSAESEQTLKGAADHHPDPFLDWPSEANAVLQQKVRDVSATEVMERFRRKVAQFESMRRRIHNLRKQVKGLAPASTSSHKEGMSNYSS
jgi:hypothetical protein